MKVLVLYQDIQSGSKIATEAIIRAYKSIYRTDTVIVHKQQSGKFKGAFSFLFNLMWSMWDFLHTLNNTPDIDIIYSAMYTFAIPWKLSNKRHIPAIFHMHGDQRFEATSRELPLRHLYSSFVAMCVDFLQHYAMKSSQLLAFVSKTAMMRFLTSLHAEMFSIKSIIILNGVDVHKFIRASPKKISTLRTKYTCRKGPQVLYVGRIDPKKGIHHLIKSVLFVPQNITLWIAYPSPTDKHSHAYLKKLHQLTVSLGLANKIRFIENPSNIVDIYQLSSCLVLPSAQEMLPLVLLEALACGVLPLATDVGGVSEIMKPTLSRFVLPSTQPKIIANKINFVLSLSKSKIKSIIMDTRTIVYSHSWEKSAKVLHEHLARFTQQK